MGIMRSIVLTIFFLVNLLTYAQPENAVTKSVDGKKYYVHTVEAGNTLYGIHKLYNTDLEKIIAANPGLSNNLDIGQQVLIPIDLDSESHYGKHTVEAGETLYGISRKYNCTVSDLKKIN